MRRVSTGCRDKQAASKVLADRLAEVDKVKAGIITPAESKISRHAITPLAGHVEDYLAHMRACGRSSSHRENTRRYLERAFTACGFSRISDLATGPMERWLLQEGEGAAEMRFGSHWCRSPTGRCEIHGSPATRSPGFPWLTKPPTGDAFAGRSQRRNWPDCWTSPSASHWRSTVVRTGLCQWANAEAGRVGTKPR